MTFKIEIEIVSNDGEVVKVMSAPTKRQADKMEDGANINLNHEKYYTRQLEVKDDLKK